MFQFLRIAARNLWLHQTRTLLIGGAIVVVTTLLVVLLSVTSGIQKTILRNSTALASGHVNIAGFFKLSQTSASAIVTDYEPLLELAKKEVPEADLIYLRLKSFGKIISDTSSIMAPIWGIDYAAEKEILKPLILAKKAAYLPQFKPGPGESETEGNLAALAQPGGIAVFASHAKKLKVRVGDTVTVSLPTYRNIYNTKDVRVVAVLADMGMMSAFSTFMHQDDIRTLYQIPLKTTGQIMISLKNAADVPKVDERLRKLVGEQGHVLMEKESQPYWMKFDRVSGESWTGQRIDVTTWQDETSYVKWVLSLLSALTVVFIGILLAIVSLGLINTLWMAIRERTSEIGTLRAIGLQRGQVLVMFLYEALLLSIGGIAVGILVGITITSLINAAHIPIQSEVFQMFLMSNVVELSVQSGDLLFAFGILSACLVAASLYPSYKASKMKPITAIQAVTT